MIAYASRTGTRRNLAALRDAGWRLMVSARGVLRTEGFPYGLDNGAWTAFQRDEPFDVDHAELLRSVRALRGMVILCGYPSELYDRALPDWRRVERAALADGALPRTEVLWINPAAIEAVGPGPLFEAAA